MNVTLLRKVYQKHRVKKRSIRWVKKQKGHDPVRAGRDLAAMKRGLTRAKNDGYRVIYLDETCFTRTSVPKVEWCHSGQNMEADLAMLQEPTLAVISAISKERGQEHYKVFERSVDTKKFKAYLQELKATTGDAKVALFMDNLAVHRSDKVKAEMTRLGFRVIWNVPYEPEYNPIEFTFSKVKQRFRALRAKKLAGVIQDGHEAMVRQAILSVRKKDIVNCIDHVS